MANKNQQNDDGCIQVCSGVKTKCQIGVNRANQQLGLFLIYYQNGTYDLFLDETLFRRFDHFEKVIKSSADVSNVVFAINFNFDKSIVQENK